MKFSENGSPLKKAPNFLAMLVAVVAAAAMWYSVSVRDRMEGQLEVYLDYLGLPPNLVVTEGQIPKITVRLRGPETLMRSLLKQRLTKAIDLSNVKKGETFVPIANDEIIPAFRAFEVIDIQPPRLAIKADALTERNVPLRTNVKSPLSGGALTVENLSVSPATVTLKGPEAVISGMPSLPLTIPLDAKAAGTTVEQNITLDTPSLVSASPPSVRVRYTITSGRKVISRLCDVKVAGNAANNFVVTPSTLSVMVEVPEALSQNAAYLNQLEVSVLPPHLEAGESRRVRLRFKLPEGMTLLGPTDEEVNIARARK